MGPLTISSCIGIFISIPLVIETVREPPVGGTTRQSKGGKAKTLPPTYHGSRMSDGVLWCQLLEALTGGRDRARTKALKDLRRPPTPAQSLGRPARECFCCWVVRVSPIEQCVLEF